MYDKYKLESTPEFSPAPNLELNNVTAWNNYLIALYLMLLDKTLLIM